VGVCVRVCVRVAMDAWARVRVRRGAGDWGQHRGTCDGSERVGETERSERVNEGEKVSAQPVSRWGGQTWGGDTDWDVLPAHQQSALWREHRQMQPGQR